MAIEEIKKNIIMLGDGAVGKTCLIKRFVLDQFDDRYITTIGTKVTKKEIFIGNERSGTKMILLIWDILGQKGYRYTQASAFGGIEGAILVADTTRLETLRSLKEYWLPSLVSVVGYVPMIILGNKADLANDREFGLPELQAFANEIHQKDIPHGCFLTSAKTGEHVEDAFYNLADVVRHVTITAKEDMPQYFVERSDIHTLVDVVDHIIADFSHQYGGLENATPVIKHQMEKVNLDIKKPTYKSVVAFIDGLANVENDFRTPDEIRMNRTKRLYMVNSLANRP